MAIKGKTFDLQTITAKDDGALYRILSGESDMIVFSGSGTALSINSNILTIAECYLLVGGRYIHIENGSTIDLGTIPNSSNRGRVIIQIDTSLGATQVTLDQVVTEIETIAAGGSYRALVQNDINSDNGGSVYEIEFATFTCSSGVASSPALTTSVPTQTKIQALQDDIETLADNLEQTASDVGDLQALGLSVPIPVNKGGSGLTSSPSMLTNLANNTAAGIFQATPRPGVTGTLPIGNGGTGLTSNPSMLTNLASNTAVSVLQASPRPGVTGTLPIANGGTGATAVGNAFVNIAGMNYSSATDFNNIRLPGIYSINPSTTSGNHPTGASDYGQLLVFCSSQDYTGTYAMTLQIFTTLFGEKIFTRTYANGEWRSWKAIRGGDIIQVAMTSQALSALTATRIKWGTSTAIDGTGFGSWASDNSYITLGKGLYRFTTHFVANPSANGFLRTCLKIGSTSTSFVATDHLYAGAGTGSNALQIGINASEVVNLTGNTNIYFLASSQNALEGFTANVQIERLG